MSEPKDQPVTPGMPALPAGVPLTTRCPQCATVFRVVPDQLRLSEGWVRCGNCKSVFDASEFLAPSVASHFDDATGPDSAARGATVQPPGTPGLLSPYKGRSVAARRLLHGDQDGERPNEADGAGLSRSPTADSRPKQASQANQAREANQASMASQANKVIEAAPASLGRTAPGAAVLPSALLLQTADVDLPQQALLSGVFLAPDAVPAFALPQQPEPQPAPDLDLDLELQPEPNLEPERASERAASPAPAEAMARTVLPPPPEHAEDLLADVSFVAAAQRRSFWNRPAAVLILTIGCGVLAAALLLQIALQKHDRLVAAVPAAAPVLNKLCRILSCGTGLQRQIDAVVIEGSAFNRRNDHYLFSVDLRSGAPVAVATPALELTLTDVQDRPVLRRVLQPAEFGAPAELAAGARWSGAVAMQLKPPAGSTPDMAAVAGYRLLAFYP